MWKWCQGWSSMAGSPVWGTRMLQRGNWDISFHSKPRVLRSNPGWENRWKWDFLLLYYFHSPPRCKWGCEGVWYVHQCMFCSPETSAWLICRARPEGSSQLRNLLCEPTRSRWPFPKGGLPKPFKFQEYVADIPTRCAFHMNTFLCLIWSERIQQIPESGARRWVPFGSTAYRSWVPAYRGSTNSCISLDVQVSKETILLVCPPTLPLQSSISVYRGCSPSCNVKLARLGSAGWKGRPPGCFLPWQAPWTPHIPSAAPESPLQSPPWRYVLRGNIHLFLGSSLAPVGGNNPFSAPKASC